MSVLDLPKPTPDQDGPDVTEASVRKRYRYWRIRIFYSMYVGYALYYFTRKSFIFAMPAMIDKLGFDKGELGIISSVLSLTYAASKFLSGIVSDKSNPRYFMGMGLILTGIFNLCFGMSSTIIMFALFWGLNGWFQGWGWPPCSRLLTHWYSQSERGRWWGLWNSSHNVGGAIIPMVAGISASFLGWRYALYVPAFCAIIIGIFLINRLRDTPHSLGLPSVEKYRGEPEAETQEEQAREHLPTKTILWDYVLRNPYMWVLAAASFFIYVVRSAIDGWSHIFALETVETSVFGAGLSILFFEVGGFIGSLSAGFFSDKIFKGRRGPINTMYSVGTLLAVLGLWAVRGTSLSMIYLLVFFVGFFIFGPQMLIGMTAAELSHKKAAGTATGFAGLFGYIGAAFAGYPIGKITDRWGWNGFFVVLVICCIVAIAFLSSLWSLKSGPHQKIED